MNRAGQLLATEDDWRGALRTVGGLLLGAGLLLVFIRRFAFVDPWGDVALLLVLLAAFVLLYGVGMLAARATAERSPWQDVFVVFGTLLVPLVLLQLVNAIDGDPGAPLSVAWIFALTAAAGTVAATAAGMRYGLLLASLAAVVAWLALWDALLGDGIFDDVGTLRVLMVAIGVALLSLGAAARMFGGPDGPARGDEILTGGGVAVVGAGAISVAAFIGRVLFGPIAIGQPSLFWDLYLLVVAVGAIALAARLGVRGLAYVGAIGLAVFVVVVGLDLDDPSPQGKLVGWPLVVLALGALAFLASLIRVIEEPEEEEDEAEEEAAESGEPEEPEDEAPEPDGTGGGQD